MYNPRKLDPDLAMVLVVDFQERLIPVIMGGEEAAVEAAKLVRGANLFEVPVMATVQYVAGIGETTPIIAEELKAGGVEVLEKNTFSVCEDDAMKKRIGEIDRPNVVVCGIESHVCVLQTVLDLIALGHTVYVCPEAIGSRRERDKQTAMIRMQQAGAIMTPVESVLFEFCHVSGTERFKKLLKIIK